jgi:hypothetical protein
MVVRCVDVRENSAAGYPRAGIGQMREGMYIDRRDETRAAWMKPCRVSLMHPLGPNSIVFEEGAGVTVNQSPSGVPLLASFAPPQGKLLEVSTTGTFLRSSVSLVEVQWSKLVRETSEGQLHLIGCRKAF